MWLPRGWRCQIKEPAKIKTWQNQKEDLGGQINSSVRSSVRGLWGGDTPEPLFFGRKGEKFRFFFHVWWEDISRFQARKQSTVIFNLTGVVWLLWRQEMEPRQGRKPRAQLEAEVKFKWKMMVTWPRMGEREAGRWTDSWYVGDVGCQNGSHEGGRGKRSERRQRWLPSAWLEQAGWHGAIYRVLSCPLCAPQAPKHVESA